MQRRTVFLRRLIQARWVVAAAAWLVVSSAALAQRPGTPRPAAPRPAFEPGTSGLPEAPAPDTSLQQDTARVEHIVLRARRAGRTVTLRWAPGTPALWIAGNDSGYVVERLIPSTTRGGAPQRTRLTPQPLRPMPIDRFRERAGADDRYAAIAAQMLYGQSTIPETSSPGYDLILRSSDLTNRHGFALFAADLSAAAADGLALRFVDPDAPEGLVLYTVRMARPSLAAGDTLAGYDPVAAAVAVPAGDTPATEAPEGFEMQPGDGVIHLRWPPGEPGQAFTAFRLERRDGTAGAFQPLHTAPLASITTAEQPFVVFSDSTAQNYRRYTYRLVGLDAFGGASAPAELVAMARDLTPPPAPAMTRTTHVRESTVQIEWSPADGPPAPDLRGYRVGVSGHPDGPFLYAEELLSTSARSATDSRAVSGEPNYYTVAAVDTAGNAAPALAMFVQLVDSVGPSVPTRLAYEARALEGREGLVTLRWRVPPEPDLYGFRVYRANERTHAFALDSRDLVQDTTYADTLDIQTLTRAIYYRVVALDRNYNPSDTTAVIRVVLPDIVPPTAPVFYDATPTDSTVALAWFLSPSEDVARQILRRAVEPDTTWGDLATLRPADSLYTDRAVVRGTRYRYTLVAVDSTGLFSDPATPVQARPYDTGLRPRIAGLHAEPTDTGARLTWQALPGGDFWYVVYRSDNPDAPLRRVANTQQTAEFAERLAPGIYRYAVQVLHRDGGASPLSDPATVEVVARRRP